MVLPTAFLNKSEFIFEQNWFYYMDLVLIFSHHHKYTN